MSERYILDSDGDPIAEEDLLTWGKWFEDASTNGERTVGRKMIGNVLVSTVFLALEHSFGAETSIPLLYETLVFGGKLNQEMERYSTKEQALEGHQAMCKRVREANGTT